MLTHFLLVLLDCGTVYQQIMYIMTLLDNLKGVFKILSYALKLLLLLSPFLFLSLFFFISSPLSIISFQLLGPAGLSFMVSFNIKKQKTKQNKKLGVHDMQQALCKAEP